MIAFLVLGSALFADAQASLPGLPPHAASPAYSPQREVELWQSVGITSGHVFGFSPDHPLFVTGVRYSYTLKRFWGWRLAYAPELVPMAFMKDVRSDAIAPGSATPADATARQYVFAGGADPVGLQLDFRDGRRLQPFGELEGGFLYFHGRVLSPYASRFMFDIYEGAGLRYFTSHHTAVSISYRYNHMSNANISHRNPGTDSHMLAFGFTFFPKAGR